MKPELFTVQVPDHTLADLRDRIRRARWPTDVGNEDRAYGFDGPYLRELAHSWADAFRRGAD